MIDINKNGLELLMLNSSIWNHLNGLVGLYGISTVLGYFMPNPLYTLPRRLEL